MLLILHIFRKLRSDKSDMKKNTTVDRSTDEKKAVPKVHFPFFFRRCIVRFTEILRFLGTFLAVLDLAMKVLNELNKLYSTAWVSWCGTQIFLIEHSGS